jgi:glycosyltransferase involved in cell wall biosynthesis
MRVALVHDYIKEYGGAERVLETLHEMFPDAPVYTSVYLPNYLGPHKERFNNWDIKPSILQWLPFKAKLISPMRLVAPFVFNRINFNDYDVVIVSATGAYIPNSIQKGKAVHVCYCHTPPRYLYGYPTARSVSPLLKPLVAIANHFLRMLDYNAAQNVDYFIANSKETRSRIEKFYRKDSTVIYPPVEIPRFKIQDLRIKQSLRPKDLKKGNYYLAGSRLARAKRVDLPVKACTELGLPLKVFGRGFAGYEDELKQMAGPTVEFLGEVTDTEKWELMKNAKAYLTASEFEDFGVLNVEVMASGTPVIALAQGGVLETIIDGKTGVYFNEPTVESLKKAIKKFEKMKFNSNSIRKQAEKFSKTSFKEKMLQFVNAQTKK